MVIGIFGESCTGKSTLAERISAGLSCEVFTGKDYLRLAKNENIANATLSPATFRATIVHPKAKNGHSGAFWTACQRICMYFRVPMRPM